MLADGEIVNALIVCAVAIAVVLVLGCVLLWVRRRALEKRQVSDPTGAFTIEGIEALRDSGQISKREFARLRIMILGLGEDADKQDREQGDSLSSDSEGDDEEDSTERA